MSPMSLWAAGEMETGSAGREHIDWAAEGQGRIGLDRRKWTSDGEGVGGEAKVKGESRIDKVHEDEESGVGKVGESESTEGNGQQM